MSGIVGIVNLDGAPVDRRLLGRMTEALAFRGPDAQESWAEGHVGLGHTLLQTVEDCRPDQQPATLDQQVWITADARVDGRGELVDRLRACGEAPGADAPDAALVLHAYRAWGDECVRYLIGDFAFALWDMRRQRLFCARDHMGVKPFYYAQVGRSFIFSNTLNCLHLHPDVSQKLNELAVADFLLFDFNQEPTTTTFKDIQRLAPAHTLTLAACGPRLKRYWELPIEEPLRYKRPGDYTERFLELLRVAVSDRLRTSRVGVRMSGGMDSTSVMVTARQLLAERGSEFDLRAHTVVFDRLIPCEERHYAGLAAREAGIPIQYLPADGYRIYDRWEELERTRPEPLHWPIAAIAIDVSRQIAAHARVELTGSGVDPSLRAEPEDTAAMVHRREWRPLVEYIAGYAVTHRRIPRVGLRSGMQRAGSQSRYFPYPNWLRPSFAERLDLRARWDRLIQPAEALHPYRAGAYRLLGTPVWAHTFEQTDPGVTQLPLEGRHPFFDVRVLQYMLALPLAPWCLEKELLRQAMRDRLAEPVRTRRKAPLAGNLIRGLLEQPNARWLDTLQPAPGITDYVDFENLPSLHDGSERAATWVNLRPRSLNCWLAGRHGDRAATVHVENYATHP